MRVEVGLCVVGWAGLLFDGDGAQGGLWGAGDGANDPGAQGLVGAVDVDV